MKTYIVFDNGGKTIDRYTVINTETADVYGISENPESPDGIGRHCGNCAAHRIVLYGAAWRQRLPAKKIMQSEAENYINNARLDPDWLGPEIEFLSLPANVREYIVELDDDTDPRHQSRAKIASLGDFKRPTKSLKSK
ncbi:MAG TPA: hypothetical protein VNU70_07120 [Puia sp.]|jgi:hypothetical protein|nr:hypothetical protein [Puia sp.]